jgi:hypothetical protein
LAIGADEEPVAILVDTGEAFAEATGVAELGPDDRRAVVVDVAEQRQVAELLVDEKSNLGRVGLMGVAVGLRLGLFRNQRRRHLAQRIGRGFDLQFVVLARRADVQGGKDVREEQHIRVASEVERVRPFVTCGHRDHDDIDEGAVPPASAHDRPFHRVLKRALEDFLDLECDDVVGEVW